MNRHQGHFIFALLLICCLRAPAQAQQPCDEGENLFKLHNFREAQIALVDCLMSGSETQEQALHLTWTYRDLKDYSDGLARLSQAIKQRPADEDLLYVCAFLRFRRNELEHSVGLLNQAYKLKPQDWRIHQLYALNFIEVGWAAAAEQELNRAIKLDPEMPELYYQLARYYYTMNQFDKAVVVSEKAISLSPEYASIYDNLGLTYAGLGDSSHAEQNFEKAIAIDQEQNSKDEWPLVDYGAFLEDKDPAKAEAVLRKALQLNPSNATAEFEFGRTMRQLGNDTEAETSLKAAIKIDPTYTTAYYILSTLARKRGDRVLAQEYLGQFQKFRDQEKRDGTSATILAARHR